jgi:hypothetical protein
MLMARRDETVQFYKLSDVVVKGVIRNKWRDVVTDALRESELRRRREST